jgi:hypothetical protein
MNFFCFMGVVNDVLRRLSWFVNAATVTNVSWWCLDRAGVHVDGCFVHIQYVSVGVFSAFF